MGQNTIQLRDAVHDKYPHSMASMGKIYGSGGEILRVGPLPYEDGGLHAEIAVLAALWKQTDKWTQVPDGSVIVIYTHYSPCYACSRIDDQSAQDGKRVIAWANWLFGKKPQTRLKLVFRDYYTEKNCPNSNETWKNDASAIKRYQDMTNLFGNGLYSAKATSPGGFKFDDLPWLKERSRLTIKQMPA